MVLRGREGAGVVVGASAVEEEGKGEQGKWRGEDGREGVGGLGDEEDGEEGRAAGERQGYGPGAPAIHK